VHSTAAAKYHHFILNWGFKKVLIILYDLIFDHLAIASNEFLSKLYHIFKIILKHGLWSSGL
jgi:hypothetical protein